MSQVYYYLNNLYDVRSKYVHAGKNIEFKYIKEVESICEEILHCLLRLQMKEENHSDRFIQKWLKNLDFLVKAIEADKEQERKAYIEAGIEYD